MAIPTALVNDVRQVIEESDSFYTSMADLVKEALREKLERIRLSRSK